MLDSLAQAALTRTVLISAYMLAFFGASSLARAQHKYGMLASSDQQLVDTFDDAKLVGVVLGCVYQLDPRLPMNKGSYPSHVTVFESYKGPLKIGDKFVVMI